MRSPTQTVDFTKSEYQDAEDVVPYKLDLNRAAVGVGVPDNPRIYGNFFRIEHTIANCNRIAANAKRLQTLKKRMQSFVSIPHAVR